MTSDKVNMPVKRQLPNPLACSGKNSIRQRWYHRWRAWLYRKAALAQLAALDQNGCIGIYTGYCVAVLCV
jgi:hypothetical protein